MRTTESARYARWSVTVAVVLTVMVAGVYAWRSWEARQTQPVAPPPVPPAVQQRSAEFTFSKVEGNNTRFIVRAAHATEFKEGGRTLLEDVWITTFGGTGKRSDQLHSRACEYLAESGMVTCPEEVLIDLQSNGTGAAASGTNETVSRPVHVVTSRLSFDRSTGMATTDQPVQFQFAEGEGRAVGLNYDSQRGELHLLQDVELVFRTPSGTQPPASGPAVGGPMTVTGGELVYRRDERLLYLNGSATMRRDRQELQAGQIVMELDGGMKARRLLAHDHPSLHDPSVNSDVSLTADELTAPLNTAGQIEGIMAVGHVVLNALRSDGRHQLTANSSTLDMIPESQQPRHLTAMGNVEVISSEPDGSKRHLQTSQLEVYFVPAGADNSRIDRATAAPGSMEWGDTTPAPSHQSAEAMKLKGQFLDGSFDEAGVLRELRANGNVEVQKRTAGEQPMTSTSRDLLAHIAADGLWSTVDQSGDVRMKNPSGEARGDRAHFNRTDNDVTLTGSVVISDASSQTRAQTATFDQSAGKLRAEGNISTIEQAKSGAEGASQSSGDPTHITSSRMTSETASGHAVYSGKARLWQGESVIQADTLDLDRHASTLIATGNVNAIFPQATQAPAQGQSAAAASPVGAPHTGFWRAESSRLVYEEDAHRARLDERAHATSPDGSVWADHLEFFFKPRPGDTTQKTAPDVESSLRGLEVERTQGVGNVRVESGDRIGTGERGDHTAADGKFILSGGHPTLIDKFGNTTAGRQLTFYFSDARIVVDSEEGSRTLTLHRVEK